MGLKYLKNNHTSNVLEEVSLVLEVGIQNKLKAAIFQGENSSQVDLSKQAEVIVQGSLPNLSLNLNPDIYNGLVNLSEVLKSRGAEEDLMQLKQEKDKLNSEATFKREVLSRGVRGYNNYWTSYFTLISGILHLLI